METAQLPQGGNPMTGITKSALVGAIAATALVPGAAQAKPTAGVSAVVKATVRAEANLDRAHELADSTRTFAQQRAKELHQRSRAQINAAAAKTRALVHRAQQTGESAAAVEATARLTAALDADAEGQVRISTVANGKLQSAAMKALVADARMELKANVDLAKLAEDRKNETTVVKALGAQIADQASDVANDLQAAASGKLSAAAQKSADLAVAIDTKANAIYSDVLARLHGTVEDTVKPAVKQIAEAVADQAVQVKREVESSTAAPHTVAISGSVGVTLAGLAHASGEASARGAVDLGGVSGSAQGEARGGLDLAGLLG
jgi:hypothetical protein